MKTGGPLGEWDELDFLAAGGMLVMAGSLAALLVPRFRKIGVLFPIAVGAVMMGAVMMGAAGFGARHRDYRPTREEEDETGTAPLR